VRRDVSNEIEERRVIRLLADLAGGMRGLAAGEVDALVSSACAPGIRVRRLNGSARLLPAIAAAAAAVLGVSVQLDRPDSQPPAAVPAGTAIVTFPEGAALQLLLGPERRAKA